MRRRTISRRLEWLVRHWPRQIFAVASGLDALTRPLGNRRGQWYFRSWVIAATPGHSRKGWPFPHRVTGPDPASLRPPTILVSFHISREWGLRMLLEQLPGQVLVLRYADRSPRRPGLEYMSTGGGELARITAAKRAGDVLRDGGFVCMVLDNGEGNARTPIAVFGRTFWVSSGAFRLARITAAPIVPVIAEWREGRMDIVLGTPIAPAEEAAMAGNLAAWLDDVFPPGERRSRLISWLSR